MKTITGLMLMAAGLAVGASPEGWESVQALHEGDRVGIVRTDMKRFEGRFEAATRESVVIRVDGQQQLTVTKNDVVRVYKKAVVNRWKRALMGAGAGVGTGAILDVATGDKNRFDCMCAFREYQRAVFYGGGAAIGAAVGAVSGGADKTLYRRPE